MNTCRWLSVVVLSSCVWGCGKREISLHRFDDKQWKEDRFACNNTRLEPSASIIRQKELLLSHDELAIVDILGKPDENELSKRNEKFYYYYVEPAARCGSESTAPKKLTVRFNAVGLAKEILIE